MRIRPALSLVPLAVAVFAASPVLAQTITTKDGTGGVSGNITYNSTYASGGTQFHVKNSGNTGSTTRKGYVRFDTSSLAGLVTTASFDLVVSQEDISVDTNVQTIHVFGLNDGAQDGWDKTAMTWQNAPGNDTSSAYLADSATATLLGTFTYQGSEGVGIVKSFSNQALIDFLNADTNGQVTFILGRTGTQGGSNLLFASETHATYSPPALVVTTGADAVAPLLLSTNPADDAPEASLDSNLVASFDEPIAAGTGNVELWEVGGGSPLESFDVATSSQLDFSGSDLTIDPTSNLVPGTEYYVLIDAAAVEDSFGNPFAGISDPLVWSFTADDTAPTVVDLVPTDNANNGVALANLVVTFNEAVVAGTGNIELWEAGGGSALETFDVASSSQISFVGTDLIIDPTNELAAATEYYVIIGSTAVKDAAGNNFAGLAADSDWNFTTSIITVLNEASAKVVDFGGSETFFLETNPYTIPFDAGNGAEKIVVTLSGEIGTGGPIVISYDGNALTRIANTASGRNLGIWYLDLAGTGYAGGDADLTIDMTNYGTVNGIGFGAVSLKGTAPGGGASAVAGGLSVTRSTPVSDSIVVTNHGAQETGNQTITAPAGHVVLYTGAIGSAKGGSSYLNSIPAGPASYTYGNNVPSFDTTSAAVFVPAGTALLAADISPADDAANVPLNSNLVVNFTEPVVAGTGNIEIWKTGVGTPLETFDVGSSAQLVFSDQGVTINLSNPLELSSEYYVLIDAGAIETSFGGAPFAGISDSTAWNFSTFQVPTPNGDRISILTATTAGEAVTTADLVHTFDTYPRTSTSHNPISPSDIAMSAGHHLVIYNSRFDEPNEVIANARSEIQTNLNLDGVDLAAGWSQCYLRRDSGQFETVTSGGAIIDVASGGEILRLQSFRTDSQTGEDVIREPGNTGLQLIKLEDAWDYLSLAGHDGGGVDQALEAGETTVAYTEILEKDSGSFGDSSDGVTLVQAGHYLVFANTYVVGDNAGSSKRTGINQQLTLDGSLITGSRTTVYLRGIDGTDEGAVTIGMLIETSSANQVLKTLLSRENEAVGAVIDGDRTSITIVKLPNSADYVRLTDVGNGQDLNGATLTYDTEAELDSAFTHNTVTNPDQVGVAAAGDYLFLASQYDASGEIQRLSYNQGWQVNGTGGIGAYGQTGGYCRGISDATGSGITVGNWSGFVSSLSTSDYVQTTVQGMAAAGASPADDLALQGVNLTSLFNGAPANPYDTWAAGFTPNPGIATDNPDSDPLSNLLEFGFGTNPNVSDGGPLIWNGVNPALPGVPVLSLPGGGGANFKARFMRRKDHGTSGSASYAWEFSSDLINWESSDDSPSWLVAPTDLADDASGDYELVEVPYPPMLDNLEEARFFRVSVTLVP